MPDFLRIPKQLETFFNRKFRAGLCKKAKVTIALMVCAIPMLSAFLKDPNLGTAFLDFSELFSFIDCHTIAPKIKVGQQPDQVVILISTSKMIILFSQ